MRCQVEAGLSHGESLPVFFSGTCGACSSHAVAKRNLSILALAKGFAMAIVAFIVTSSIAQTAVIAIFSAIITGCFLVANTYIQHRLIQRDLTQRMSDKQDKVLALVEDLHSEVREE